jgi:ABC-type transporter MlaC component
MTGVDEGAVEFVRGFAASLMPQAGQNPTRAEIGATVEHHVGIEALAQRVVGQPWRAATPAQRARLCSALLPLVVTAFAEPFLAGPQAIQILPLRAGMDRLRAVVSANQHVRGGVVKLSWCVERGRDGLFLYDASVEGVSLTDSLRSQFQAVLSQEGVDGLTARLEAHAR